MLPGHDTFSVYGGLFCARHRRLRGMRSGFSITSCLGSGNASWSENDQGQSKFICLLISSLWKDAGLQPLSSTEAQAQCSQWDTTQQPTSLCTSSEKGMGPTETGWLIPGRYRDLVNWLHFRFIGWAPSLWSQTVWMQILSLPLTSRVVLTSPHLNFLSRKMKVLRAPTRKSCHEDTWQCKVLRIMPDI